MIAGLVDFDATMDALGVHPVQWTVVVLALTTALTGAMHYLRATLNIGRFAWQQRLRTRLGIAPDAPVQELGWLLFSMHVVLWPVVVYLVLRIWGLHDEGHGVAAAMFSKGVKLGSLTVVPGKLIVGVLMFAVLLTFTRWLRKKLEFDWLPRTPIEPGTRDTVATLFGYITFVVAVLMGLSTAGLDLTKLAILAGALSVGIGFGLQNIVNNFVSGLILLFERPIRAGDYVFVGQTQGFVRRIRIRSTQIENLDRETIIVPNSDLLSNHLRRLNLRDRHGNVTVAVSVAYGSDTAQVQALLLQVADQHAQLMKRGQVRGVSGPRVVFTAFGASSLDFELKGQVSDSSKRADVASDLRFAIEKAFREAGIEMPFPQQDVHIRSWPASGTSTSRADGAAETSPLPDGEARAEASSPAGDARPA
ncbi:MAG TPA: mechanosensitive ion channel domain-containing protein [Solimonas sp.]